MSDDKYIIASLKHTHKWHEHITFWGPEWRGYVLAITDGRVGLYGEDESRRSLNDGVDCIAVPASAVTALLSPTPHFLGASGAEVRFYDTEGPVVDNTRPNWNRLIAASLPREGVEKIKPGVFRGKRRSVAIKDGEPVA